MEKEIETTVHQQYLETDKPQQKNFNFQINQNLIENEKKHKNVKITEYVNGKAVKIAEGGFGKVHKVIKYLDKY